MNKDELKGIVKEALVEHYAEFSIGREDHYRDHEFVREVRESSEKIKNVACGAVTKTLVLGFIGLIVWGVYHWIEGIIFKK